MKSSPTGTRWARITVRWEVRRVYVGTVTNDPLHEVCRNGQVQAPGREIRGPTSRDFEDTHEELGRLPLLKVGNARDGEGCEARVCLERSTWQQETNES